MGTFNYNCSENLAGQETDCMSRIFHSFRP
jgi:hypothetical protein